MNSMRPDGAVATVSRYGVAACIVGYLLCPVVYLAMGAAPAFSLRGGVIVFTPLALSEVWLACRLGARGRRRDASAWWFAMDVLAVVVVGLCLYVLSGIWLVRGVERVGDFALRYLIASVLSLPIVYWRRHVLATRLAWLPAPVAATLFALVVIVVLVAASTLLYVSPGFV